MTDYWAAAIYSDGELRRDAYVTVENGNITAVGAAAELDEARKAAATKFDNAMVVPGFVNTHCHSFQSLLKGFCDDQSFFVWRDEALYKYARILTEEDIYRGALFAFGELLKQGVTTVCDFFYINDQANVNANAVIRAANDLGMRITLARTMYDWDGAPLRFCETVEQAVENTEALMAEHSGNAMVSVIPAPHSLHGASVSMIEAGAALAEVHDTVFHMHVAEGEYERQMSEEKYGASPIRFLDRLGVLSRRFVGIHGVWVDEGEIALMAETDAGLAYCPSSNMFLGDGITPLREMLAMGVVVSLGADGGCSNNRASIVEEMRMASLLQKVKHRDSTVTNAKDMFLMGTANGGRHLNRPIGKIEAGYHADFTVIDLNDLSMQPVQNADKNLVYAMQPSAIQSVYVNGICVVNRGQILTVPEPVIVEQVQATTAGWT